jgi:hypothetical protein
VLACVGERSAIHLLSAQVVRMCLARGWRISKEVALSLLSFEHYARGHTMLAFLGTRVDEQKIWVRRVLSAEVLEKINLKKVLFT